jgi:hypothetical protein
MTCLFQLLVQEEKLETILVSLSQWTEAMIVAVMLLVVIRFCLSAIFNISTQLHTDVFCISESVTTLWDFLFELSLQFGIYSIATHRE